MLRSALRAADSLRPEQGRVAVQFRWLVRSMVFGSSPSMLSRKLIKSPYDQQIILCVIHSMSFGLMIILKIALNEDVGSCASCGTLLCRSRPGGVIFWRCPRGDTRQGVFERSAKRPRRLAVRSRRRAHRPTREIQTGPHTYE